VDLGWRMFEYRQGRGGAPGLRWLLPLLDRLVGAKVRARLGGRLRVAVCGGAPLSPAVSRLFIGLGVPLVQGYGLTETSPVVAVNRLEDNDPQSVGPPLEGVEVRLGEAEELIVRSPGVMLGYYHNEPATRAVLDEQGWFRTGDKAQIRNGKIYITGRLKEIIVLANGEKIPPADVESAICADPLFEQALVLGEAKPFLCALLVLNRERWQAMAREQGWDADAPEVLQENNVQRLMLERVAEQTKAFPGYAQIRKVALRLEPWTVENGLMTPTLKLRRTAILQACHRDIAALYAGH